MVSSRKKLTGQGWWLMFLAVIEGQDNTRDQGSVIFFLVSVLYFAFYLTHHLTHWYQGRLTGVGSNGSSNIDNQISWFSSRSPSWKKLINPDLIFDFIQSLLWFVPSSQLCLSWCSQDTKHRHPHPTLKKYICVHTCHRIKDSKVYYISEWALTIILY